MMMMTMLLGAMEFYYDDNGYVCLCCENNDFYDLDNDYSGTPLIWTPAGHAIFIYLFITNSLHLIHLAPI